MKIHTKKQTVIARNVPPMRFIVAMFLVTLFLAACGDDNKNAGGTVEDGEVVAIVDKTISGVSQKGPFVNGSSVTVQELNGKTLAQTGLGFEGKIKNDLGEFTVKVNKLESQYALLKANGYYRNEVTGDKSKGQVTLYALTDLSNRDEVNVNLLTHLAYERSLYLATVDTLSVAKAKKQAEAEIFKSFGIEENFAAAEDLNIFGADDQSAALLAVSILMQSDLSEGDFSERLADYAADIESDGIWNDAKTATEIADWANSQWLGSGLVKIRDNITKWEISADAPSFEKYVNNFWWQNYGLGICDAKREGEVLKNQNTASVNADVYYICKSKSWQVASDIEKDTYGLGICDAKRDGVVLKNQNTASVNADVYYICKSSLWQVASDIEKDTATWGVGKFDGEVRAGQVNETVYYIYETSGNAWRKATTLEKDTYDFTNNKDWSAGVDGEIKEGSVTDSVYVYDATAWRVADEIEKVLGGCVVAIADSLVKVGSTYYICSPRKWVVATELQYDTYKQSCAEFGQIIHGNINADYAYFCYGKEWKRFYGNENITYGKLLDERDGQIYRTVKIGKQTWMAENLNYADSAQTPSLEESCWCYEYKDDNCVLYGRHYNWYSVFKPDNPLDCTPYPCKLKQLTTDVQGFCPMGWHLPVQTEWQDLFDEVGGASVAGERLKSVIGWKNNGNGTDTYGFSAMPAGERDEVMAWGYSGETALFWSYTDNGENDPHFVDFSYDRESAVLGSYKYSAISIRCIKD